MFDNFLKILEGMIALKVECRVGMEELQDILLNHELFRNMKLPVEQESPRLKHNPYSNSDQYNVVAQSKIIFVSNQDKLQNRLINEDFSVNLLQSTEKNPQE